MDHHMANDPINNRQQNTTREGSTLQPPKQKNWTNCYKNQPKKATKSSRREVRHQFYTRIKNLTSIRLNTEEEKLLNYGLNYSIERPTTSYAVLSQRPHDKDICRGGEYHRLHVQFRPPEYGPVRPETCRGKRIADIVRRRKNSVSSWK